MRRSTTLFVLCAVVMAAVFIRLGFWQLDRRHQRLAQNAIIRGHMTQAPVDLRNLSGDTAAIHYRRVRVTGHPDFDRDLALTLRGNAGSPGVDILTPVIVAGSDSAVLVNRGWIYAPDGMTADLSRWREADTTWVGYVEEFESAATDSVRLNGIRRTSYHGISRVLPYPVLTFYIVATSDSAPGAGRIVRLGTPVLNEGPHLNYAFQWFSFAAIAVVGAGFIMVRSMRSPEHEDGENTP
jgi:surfeit locus 1 family protein